jgi:hypothetical protein
MKMYHPDIPDSRTESGLSEAEVSEGAFDGVWKHKGWKRREAEIPQAVSRVPGLSQPHEPDPLSIEVLEGLNMTKLKAVARGRGLKVGGKKDEVIERIREDAGFEKLDD